MSDLSFGEVGEILQLIESMNCRYLTLEYGDLRLQVRRGPPEEVPVTAGNGTGDGARAASAGTAPATAPQGSPATAPAGTPVTAPAGTPVTAPDGVSPRGGGAGEPDTGGPDAGGPDTESTATGRQVAVRAPMAGTFYSRPAPGEPQFATPGDHVEAGQTVGLVEVMKLFTELKAEAAGNVARICAEDGELVDYEQPLVWIEPS